MSALGIADFISDENLLGPWFSGQSWDAWRIVLKAAFGEPLDPAERVRFGELAERDPPRRRVRELWLAIGRRAGKDSIASAVAAYFGAFGDFRGRLRPGERAVILCLATNREQAGIVFGYIRAYFEEVPLLAPLVARFAADTVELKNGIDIIVATANFRGLRGKTVVLAIFDEVAFWRDESGPYANPDIEVYGALVPAMATLRAAGAMMIGISTVYRRAGLLFDKWRKHHGAAGDDDVLVIRQPSRVFNALLDEADIAADLARDPERAAAEWLSEWRSDLADFVDRAVVEAAVPPGRYELPRLLGARYFAFVDPSGGSADSMTLAVCHADKDGRGVLDALRERRPPFSPEDVVVEFSNLLKSYGISTVTGDRYAGEWPRERFSEHGVRYQPAEQSKSQIYVEFLPLLNAAKVELLDNARLVAQLVSLERRTSRGTGRDVVDHPPGGHDDLSNAAAGALVLAAGKSDGLAVWRAIARNNDPPTAPPRRPPAPPGHVWVELPHPIGITFDDGQRFDTGPGRQLVPQRVAALPWMARYRLPA